MKYSLDGILTERHSVRNFDSREVNIEDILSILNAGRLAPSAKNRQPWRFLIATKEQKEKVANVLWDWADKNILPGSSVGTTAKIIHDAPVLIVIFMPEETPTRFSDIVSLGGCLENMSLKAVDLELGSLIVCDFIDCVEEVSRIFEKELPIWAMFLIGHEKEKCERAVKKELSSLIES